MSNINWNNIVIACILPSLFFVLLLSMANQRRWDSTVEECNQIRQQERLSHLKYNLRKEGYTSDKFIIFNRQVEYRYSACLLHNK